MEVKDPGPAIPLRMSLEQNYPNPFNPTTTISFTLPHPGFARLAIYNLLGQQVSVLLASEMSAGRHTVRWDAGNVPTGVYFYRLETGKSVETRKLIVVK